MIGLRQSEKRCRRATISLLEVNHEIHLFVKERTCLTGLHIMLICMKNFPVNGPILDNQSEDSYIAWLDLKQQDENEPWLFYGEDEDFINAA